MCWPDLGKSDCSVWYYGAVDPGAPTTNVKTSTTGPSRGAGAEGPGAPTINVKTSMVDPREVPELLEHISSLLGLGTSADAFLEAWTCRVPP
jgi:hypothetical protein